MKKGKKTRWLYKAAGMAVLLGSILVQQQRAPVMEA